MDLVQTAVGDGATKLLIRENMAGGAGFACGCWIASLNFMRNLKAMRILS